jgi:hypothetical protein
MGYVQDLENGLVDCCRNDHKDANGVAMDVVMLSLRTAKARSKVSEGLDLKSFREAYEGSLFLFSFFLRGHFSSFMAQNDVILGFPSILIVSSNG